jgi:hypothetical protein
MRLTRRDVDMLARGNFDGRGRVVLENEAHPTRVDAQPPPHAGTDAAESSAAGTVASVNSGVVRARSRPTGIVRRVMSLL